MTKCWKDDPNLRPSFKNLRDELKEMENQRKVELYCLQRGTIFFSFLSLIVRICHNQLNLITTSRSVVYGFNLCRF